MEQLTDTQIDELHDVNERLLTVMNTIEEHINIIALDGSILWHNQGHRGHRSIPPGSKCWKIFEGREARCPHCVHPDVLRDGKPRDYETRLGGNTPNPSDWWVRAVPLRNKQGEIYAILESAIDITSRKRADAELQKIQKLQSLGTLAGGIAHDFNNIMMGLYGHIALAKYELPEDHPGVKALEEAGKSMERAVRLTKQLLTFSKGGDPIMEDVSLGTLIEETARFDLVGSDVRLVYKPAADLWLSKVDKGQIQQVVSNLTTNARQAMPSGGHFYITLENAAITNDDIPGLAQGKYIKITVRDEGTGIDPNVMGRIFDPYFTTKSAGQGLGLATTHSIIRKHGGHVDVQSVLGQGTTFTVYLPASDAPPLDESVPESKSTSGLKSAPKILILDDEEVVRLIGERWLQRAGCTVATASHGKQAIELYKHAHSAREPFDVMILDLTIPGGMGGQEVFAEIRAIDPGARAIVSSGYSEGSAMVRHAASGFKAAIAKPYTEHELMHVIEKVLGTPALS